jgi:hypothetical protein
VTERAVDELKAQVRVDRAEASAAAGDRGAARVGPRRPDRDGKERAQR